MNIFTYYQPFGMYFKYRHQVDGHNNWIHAPIYLDSKWETKFYPYWNFFWYLSVSEVNTALASGHFQNYGLVQLSLEYWRDL